MRWSGATDDGPPPSCNTFTYLPASSLNVRRHENGAAFVLPCRLNDAFEALAGGSWP